MISKNGVKSCVSFRRDGRCHRVPGAYERTKCGREACHGGVYGFRRDPYNSNFPTISLESPLNLFLFGLAFGGLEYAPMAANGAFLFPVGDFRYVTLKNKVMPFVFNGRAWTRQELAVGYQVFGKKAAWNPCVSVRVDYVDSRIRPGINAGLVVGVGRDGLPQRFP